jgi:hypothetical protein
VANSAADKLQDRHLQSCNDKFITAAASPSAALADGQKSNGLRIVLEDILEYYEVIDFRPDDISYPPVQPVQTLTTLPKIRYHQPAKAGFTISA